MNPVDTEIYISPKMQRKHLRGFGGYRGMSIYGAGSVVGSCVQHRGIRVEERGDGGLGVISQGASGIPSQDGVLRISRAGLSQNTKKQ